MRVLDTLESLADGSMVEDLVAGLPYVTREDVPACLAYAVRREAPAR